MNVISEIAKHTDFILSIDLKQHSISERLYRRDIHTLRWAAKIGYVSIVKYLTAIDDSECYDTIAPTAMDLACEYGHLTLVKWFHKKLYISTEYAMNHAAKNGHLKIVQWLYKHKKNNDINAALNWAKLNIGENINTIKFLLRFRLHNTYIDTISYYIMSLNYNYKYIRLLPVKEDTWKHAGKHGNLELIKKLHIYDRESYDSLAMDLAAGNGHLEVVQWLYKNDYKISSITMNLAVMNNQLEIIKYLYEIKEINIKEAIHLARYCGYLKIIEFLDKSTSQITFR
jgi:ankyrin repeat protein